MAEDERLICPSSVLESSRDGVRFTLHIGAQAFPAFAIRFGGAVRAYLNRCGHMPMELDWIPGRFFDGDGLLLICSTHGAVYDPLNGRCRGGPCEGVGLSPLEVVERDGNVYLRIGRPAGGHVRIDPPSEDNLERG